MAYDPYSAEGRHAAASAGVNTLSGRPTVNGRELSDEEMAALQEYFSALADEDARRFDVGQSNVVASREAQVQQVKRALAENRRQFDKNFGLSQEDRALNREKFGEDTRRYNQDFGESARRFDTTTGVSLLGQEAQNRGALNFVQGDMLAQGATRISPWLQSLRSGQPVQYGGGTATGMNPTPLTNMTLANQYAGNSPAAQALAPAGSGMVSPGVAGATTDQYGRPRLSPDVQAAVDAGSEAFTSGLANKGLGWLENQTDEQQKGLVSIGDYLGRNVNADIQYYKRSRPGQGSALSA